eukprot:4337357-Prymnesium_polylepis.2
MARSSLITWHTPPQLSSAAGRLSSNGRLSGTAIAGRTAAAADEGAAAPIEPQPEPQSEEHRVYAADLVAALGVSEEVHCSTAPTHNLRPPNAAEHCAPPTPANPAPPGKPCAPPTPANPARPQRRRRSSRRLCSLSLAGLLS